MPHHVFRMSARRYEGRAAHRNTTHLVKKTKMLFAWFPFLHIALHGMGVRGGVYRSFVLRTRVHVKSCSFSRRDVALSVLSSTTLMILECSSLLTCVHLNFSSCRTPSVALEPDCWGYHLICFLSNQETKTEKVLYPRWV